VKKRRGKGKGRGREGRRGASPPNIWSRTTPNFCKRCRENVSLISGLRLGFCVQQIMEYVLFVKKDVFEAYANVLFLLWIILKHARLVKQCLPVGRGNSGRCQMHCFLGPLSPHPKQHHDRFSRFSTARSRDQRTHRQTDHATSVTVVLILPPSAFL